MYIVVVAEKENENMNLLVAVLEILTDGKE